MSPPLGYQFNKFPVTMGTGRSTGCHVIMPSFPPYLDQLHSSTWRFSLHHWILIIGNESQTWNRLTPSDRGAPGRIWHREDACSLALQVKWDFACRNKGCCCRILQKVPILLSNTPVVEPEYSASFYVCFGKWWSLRRHLIKLGSGGAWLKP
jgi:hypothetical protein